MAHRPRIRTIKPERMENEKRGQVSREARLLEFGLTMRADDEGRLADPTPVLRGALYPFDEDVTLATIDGWLAELEDARLIAVYHDDEGRRIIALLTWEAEQKVDKAKPSELPPPPDRPRSRSQGGESRLDTEREGANASEKSRNGAKPRETSRSVATSRGGPGPGPGPRPGPGDGDPDGSPAARGQARDGHEGEVWQLPDDYPPALAPFVVPVTTVLRRIAAGKPGSYEPEPAAVARVLLRFPRRDFLVLAEDYEHWALHGRGRGKRPKDLVRGYRNWIEKEPDVLRPTLPPDASRPADPEPQRVWVPNDDGGAWVDPDTAEKLRRRRGA